MLSGAAAATRFRRVASPRSWGDDDDEEGARKGSRRSRGGGADADAGSSKRRRWRQRPWVWAVGRLRTVRRAAVMRAAAALALLGAALLLLLRHASASAHAAAAEELRRLTVVFGGAVPAPPGVAGTYWRLDLKPAYAPPTPGPLARARYAQHVDNRSCWDLAAATREPFVGDYVQQQAATATAKGTEAAAAATAAAAAAGKGKSAQQQQQQLPPPPGDFPGGVPRAAWQWRGGKKITRAQFDAVPFVLRESPAAGGCPHCTFALRYKILGGQLYAHAARRRRDLAGQEEEAELLEGLLLAALATHALPDADLLVHLGDGAPRGLPLLQVNIDRGADQAGFAIPKYAWRDALGPTQFAVLAECLAARYPPAAAPAAAAAAAATTTAGSSSSSSSGSAAAAAAVKARGGGHGRVPKAVWRGSATDAAAPLVDEANALDVARVRLHLYGRWFPGLFDAHLTGFPQQAFQTQCVPELLPPGPPLPLDDVNRYALVLDADGNAWSDRFRFLAHFNTPVVKQASNLTAFFEHVLAAPGVAVEPYARDARDLPVRVEALLAEVAGEQGGPGTGGGGRLAAAVARRQALAHVLLGQMAVVRAAAYAVAKAGELSGWQVKEEPGYELVPFARCCKHTRALPPEFVARVRARGEALGQPRDDNEQQKQQQQQQQQQQQHKQPPLEGKQPATEAVATVAAAATMPPAALAAA